MTLAVIADTGPLYAAVDPDDQHHDRAQRQLKTLEKDSVSVLLTYPTMLETYTLVMYRLGIPASLAWLEDVQAGAAILNPTSQDYLDATALVGQFADQSISLFDSVLAIVASRIGAPVWTFDYHFDVMKSDVWR